MKPLVSICCLTYNHEKFIRECLDGFLIQKTSFAFEILIHDDASTDETVQIIKEFEKQHPVIIKPIYQNENQLSKGVRVNTIFNFPRAKGKYIALCEGDDYWTDPLKLQKQVEFLEVNPDFAICFHNAKVIDEENSNEYLLCGLEQKEITTTEDILKSNYIPTASVVFRNSNLMKQLPEWFYKLPVGDWPLHILNAQYGKIKYIPEVMSVYRIHGNSMWSSKGWMYQLKSIIELYNAINSHFNFQYDSLFEKVVDEHINWRFSQAIIALKQENYEVAYDSFAGLSYLFPQMVESKYGELFLETKIKGVHLSKQNVINDIDSKNLESFLSDSKNLKFRSYPFTQNRLEEIKSLFYDQRNGTMKNKQNKDDVHSQLLLAEELIESQKISEAENILVQILSEDKNNIDAHNDLAVVYILDEKYKNALTHIEQVLIIESTNETALSNLAYLKNKMEEKKLEKAIPQSSDQSLASNMQIISNHINTLDFIKENISSLNRMIKIDLRGKHFNTSKPFEKSPGTASLLLQDETQSNLAKKEFNDLFRESITQEIINNDNILIPATVDREGYYDNRHLSYWFSGLYDYKKIINYKTIKDNDKILDWGGASGRVARHFITQNQNVKVAVADININHVNYINQFFPDNVQGVKCTSLPPLPYDDNSFNLICAFSVFTHIDVYETSWLSELSRILKRDGMAYFTIHSENTWEQLPNIYLYSALQKNHKFNSDWKKGSQMPSERLVYEYLDGDDYSCNIFFSTEYIHRVWGKFFNIVNIEYNASGYQTAVVLTKK